MFFLAKDFNWKILVIKIGKIQTKITIHRKKPLISQRTMSMKKKIMKTKRPRYLRSPHPQLGLFLSQPPAM